MKDIVGKYEGIKVYRVTLPEYVNSRLYKDEENMYLIDGELIYKNEIFAKYDGKYVSELDAHLRKEYYTVPKITVKDRGVEFSSSIGTDEGDNDSNFEFKTVDEILDSSFGSFDTEMTDIDAFLKANLEF